MATVTQKGQVTIPKEVRDALGIFPGTEVEFVRQDGRWVLRRKIDRAKLQQWIGVLSPQDGLPTRSDEFIEALRGPFEP